MKKEFRDFLKSKGRSHFPAVLLASAECAPVKRSATGSHARRSRRRRSQMFAMCAIVIERWPTEHGHAVRPPEASPGIRLSRRRRIMTYRV